MLRNEMPYSVANFNGTLELDDSFHSTPRGEHLFCVSLKHQTETQPSLIVAIT